MGEFLAFNGIYKQSSVHCFLACGGILFGLLYSFWLYSRLFFGVLQTAYIKAFVDLTKLEFYIMLPYGILSVGFGIYPGVVLNLCTWL